MPRTRPGYPPDSREWALALVSVGRNPESLPRESSNSASQCEAFTGLLMRGGVPGCRAEFP